MLLFLLLVIAMFLRCCCRRLCLSPPFFPPDLPSYQALYFLNSVIFLFSAVLFSHWLFFYGRFICCCFCCLWWPFSVSCCFGSFRAFLALFFCAVFVFWPHIDRTLVCLFYLWHFCFVCVFSCWFVVLLFGLLFSCCCHPWQISSPRALSAPMCLVYLPPHIKLVHSVHPHHWWEYMHL